METNSDSYSLEENKRPRGRSTEYFTEEVYGNFLNSKNKPITKIHLLRNICAFVRDEHEKKIAEGTLDESQRKNYNRITTFTLINKLRSNEMKDILQSEREIIVQLFVMEYGDLLRALNIFCKCEPRHNETNEQCCSNIEKLLRLIEKICNIDPCDPYMSREN
ncbi:hypothetical protein SteCoe_23022 [Stentor coeruleus]|uniref:Uncharacterized protein n=1 Tax=Stentor coeruleus TaxID=5963 RepID=A0A1R2BKT5_9CILI|nr:hypothetical protein SteCoe_23022 [Stentor coeruleus]